MWWQGSNGQILQGTVSHWRSFSWCNTASHLHYSHQSKGGSNKRWPTHTMEYYHSALKGMKFCVTTWMYLKTWCYAKNARHKRTDMMAPLTRGTQNRQIHWDRKWNRGCAGLRGAEEKELLYDGWFLFAVETVVAAAPYTECT